MNRQKIEEWFEKECEKAGESPCLTKVTFQEKWLAFQLVAVVPVVLTGCAPEPTVQQSLPEIKNATPSSSTISSTQNLTAYDECMWEQESLGDWELDCGDDTSSWYRSHGYSSKHSYVPSTSRFYRMMKETSSSTVTSTPTAPSSQQSKPASSTGSSSGLYKSGVGTGGMSSGGTSVGGQK